MDCLLRSLQKTSNYFMKICNFAPIKKGFSMWFLFGPFYMNNHPFTWIHHWFSGFNYFFKIIIAIRGVLWLVSNLGICTSLFRVSENPISSDLHHYSARIICWISTLFFSLHHHALQHLLLLEIIDWSVKHICKEGVRK